jgi:6-phosphogluconolactonase
MRVAAAIVRCEAWMAIAFALAAAAHTHAQNSTETASTSRVYISNVADGNSDGIYLAELDLDTGELTMDRRVARLSKASFLALHPHRDYLFSTCHMGDHVDSQGGALAAFKIDAATGELTLLNHQSSRGAGPCYVSLDREGKHALVANYDGGSVAVLPIGADGKLGPATAAVAHQGSSVNPSRQAGPHPHAIDVDLTNSLTFVPDLGIDQVTAYQFDAAAGTLAPQPSMSLASSPGAGPRHGAFHPNGQWAYFINELDSTITAVRCDVAAGAMTPLGTVSTLPQNAAAGNITGEIVVHPNGKFLYGSNRGHDSIASFAIDQDTGRLSPLGRHPAGGRVPRNFSIDPSGKFLLSANLDSNSVTVHRIDPGTGALSSTPHQVSIPQPYCIAFAP